MSTLLLLVLFAPPAAWAAPAPSPEELLSSTFEAPLVAYEGRMMVTHWFGKQARAEEVEVYYSPPDRTRREYLTPDGAVSRVVVSDGEKEEVLLVRQNKILKGDAVKKFDKLMSAEREKELLLKNYRLSVIKEDKVAGRAAWVLELRPLTPGKPFQRLWVDEETRVILENKRFLPKKSFAALSRFSRFEPKKELDETLFTLDLASSAVVAQEDLEPDFLSLEELGQATGKAVPFPPELPGGFAFESADFFMVNKRLVRQARYTDGLAVVSLFATDRPVRLPKTGTFAVAAPTSGKGAKSLRFSSSGEVLSWKRGSLHYTLMGDLSRELMANIASRVK